MTTDTTTAAVILCYGNRDTRKGTRNDYRSINWEEILALAKRPACAEKDDAPAIIPSTYLAHDGREAATQRKRGRFVFLVGDIDEGNHARADVIEAVREATGRAPSLDLLVYSTSSATRELRKWRFIIRLAHPLAGCDYGETQHALFDLLEAQGIICDRALAVPNQLAYLPCVAPSRRGEDSRPLAYGFELVEDLAGFGLDLSATPIPAQVAKRKVEREARAAQAAAEAAERKARRTGEEGSSAIEAFNASHSIEELLVEYGYEDRGDGENWRSPNQGPNTTSFAMRVFGDHWVSLSGSDAKVGLGQQSANGSRFGDAFDLFCHYAHGGDIKAALAAASVEQAAAQFEDLGPDEDYLERRREKQREENREIGSELPPLILPEILTAQEMLARFAFATAGSAVVDLLNPARDFALPDFRNAMAASRVVIEGKELPVSAVWLKHPKRITVAGRTFRPGRDEFTTDPEGRPCVNTWRPYDRAEPSPAFPENVALFEDHITFLFGADAAPRFLNWLAHIEQQPGVLPHHAWLHVSHEHGTGRNWLAGVLTRIWRGRTAASFNLTGTLNSGFNAHLSAKLLAIVDEVREGGRDDAWAHSEALKVLVTQETRLINEKYGRQWTEFNCCRLLLFSNHMNALPLDDTDRRFEVASWAGVKRTPAYYARLYAALADDAFVGDVAAWLARRDISRFNPGAHAVASAAKRILISGQTSEPKSYGLAIRDHWPSDVVSNEVMAWVIDPRSGGEMNARVRNVATECGMRPLERVVKVNGKATRIYIIRNAPRWERAEGKEIAAEVKRGLPQGEEVVTSWREYLDGLMAE